MVFCYLCCFGGDKGGDGGVGRAGGCCGVGLGCWVEFDGILRREMRGRVRWCGDVGGGLRGSGFGWSYIVPL